MLKDLDLLGTKIAELARLVQSLRTENQQLRAQLTASSAELEAMRARIDEAQRSIGEPPLGLSAWLSSRGKRSMSWWMKLARVCRDPG